MFSKFSTKKIVLASFLVDLLDIVSNLIVSLLSGSAVIFAGLVQGLSDSVGSFLLVVGYRQSRRKIDRRGPFGYSREIFFWSLLSSTIMLFFGSGLSIWRGYEQLLHPEVIEHKILVVLVLFISFVTNGYAFFQSYLKIKGKSTGFLKAFARSPRQLVKTAFLRNALGTLSAVVGLFAMILYDIFSLSYFDAFGAMAIGVMIAVFAVILISQTRYLIAGESVSDETLMKIKFVVSNIPEVANINRLTAVYSGSEHIMVELDLDLKENLNTSHIEGVFDQIQKEIKIKVPEIDRVWIDLNSLNES